jgi:hypothetical protein
MAGESGLTQPSSVAGSLTLSHTDGLARLPPVCVARLPAGDPYDGLGLLPSGRSTGTYLGASRLYSKRSSAGWPAGAAAWCGPRPSRGAGLARGGGDRAPTRRRLAGRTWLGPCRIGPGPDPDRLRCFRRIILISPYITLTEGKCPLTLTKAAAAEGNHLGNGALLVSDACSGEEGQDAMGPPVAAVEALTTERGPPPESRNLPHPRPCP